MIKESNKLKVLAFLLFSVVFLTLITQQNITSYTDNDTDLEQTIQIENETDKVKESAVITAEIIINGSALGENDWNWASSQDWCDGLGTTVSPYIISNQVIDGQNLHGGITIQNSNSYVKIENNEISNIGDLNSHSAGIEIYKSRNIDINNNNISSNSDGNYGIHVIGDGFMMMEPSRDINITENYIINTETGIYIEDGCYDMTISENTLKYNSIYGIYIFKECKKLTISKNIISENDIFGIADTGSNMWGWTLDDGNNIFNNTITKNAIGMYLSRTKYDKIGYNDISSNRLNGIYISGSSENYIANNTIEGNSDKGILMVEGSMGSFRNKIYGNYFRDNGEHAFEDTDIPWIDSRNNWTWWQDVMHTSKIGNYWDDYTGKDTDDDAIGDAPYNFTGNKDIAPIWNDGIEGHVIEINGSKGPMEKGSWDWAKDRFWCTGMGMIMDPYVIGPNDIWDGEIDAWGEDIGISIIENEKYFIIEGVTITNSTTAGISLKNDDWVNCKIKNNNISLNEGHGIYFENSFGINITGNIINNNEGSGIYLFNKSGWVNPYRTIIQDNTISDNDEHGIYIGLNCDNNNITRNLIANNGLYGVNINDNSCNDTTINDNIFKENTEGNARDMANDTRWYLGGRGNDWDDYDGSDGDDDGIGDTGVSPFPLKAYEFIDGASNSKDRYPICDDGLAGTHFFVNGTGNAWNNWEWASKRLFVSGSGQSGDPYVIENVKFDGADQYSPIRIVNSITTYFRIENCTLENIGGSGVDSGKAGIYLSNVMYGDLINNTYSTNYDGNYGIILDKPLFGGGCTRINITNNVIENSEYSENSIEFKYGIYLKQSGAATPSINRIDGNIIRHNKIGVYLYDGSPSNNITNNMITDNSDIGIFINKSCNGNQIFNNDILRNGNGTIIENNAMSNKIVGNNIKYNTYFGLYVNSSNNEIYFNNFTDNIINAQDDTPMMMGINTWYKLVGPMSYRGNYWSNYTEGIWAAYAVDADDDGIGDIYYNITGIANRQDWGPIWDDGYNGGRITINGSLSGVGNVGSWDWAASKIWCSGSGFSWDPYIIKSKVGDLKIDGMQTNSCIYIFNSDVYFVIDGAVLYNSSRTASPEPAGGIRLVDVSNGVIINCNLSNNGGNGIVLRGFMGTYNITIQNNFIENNNGSGVYINGSMCYDNLVYNNTIKSNHEYGISVGEYADRNTMSYNYLYNNTDAGVYIGEGGWWGNTIINNTILYGDVGIGIDGYNMVSIFYNNISDTDSHGIAIQYTSMMMMWIRNINITGNRIYDCGGDGINFGWDNPKESEFNKIIENYIYDNDGAGISLTQCVKSIFYNNTLENNYIGIELTFENIENQFIDNDILNNTEYGISITDTSCISNRLYRNNFTGNGINAFNDGISNEWYFMEVGNYWDDYTGTDPDDDGKGGDFSDPDNKIFVPYNITGYIMSSKDYYPIWWDGPNFGNDFVDDYGGVITDNDFGVKPPKFKINVTEGDIDYFWYEIEEEGSSTPIKIQVGMEIINGEIDINLWNGLANGTYTITFYVNDSQGYVASFDEVVVKRTTTGGGTVVIAPDDDDSSSTTITTEEKTFLNDEEDPYFFIFRALLTGIISASAGIVLKMTYSASKRRKEQLKEIGQKLDRIDNVEKYLKEKLDYDDWEKIKNPFEHYQSEKLSQRDLIKLSKKSIGKKFTGIFIKPKHIKEAKDAKTKK